MATPIGPKPPQVGSVGYVASTVNDALTTGAVVTGVVTQVAVQLNTYYPVLDFRYLANYYNYNINVVNPSPTTPKAPEPMPPKQVVSNTTTTAPALPNNSTGPSVVPTSVDQCPG